MCDVLFISERPLWPLDQGFRVHGIALARALTHLDQSVRLASLQPTQHPDTPDDIRAMLTPWPTPTPNHITQAEQAWQQGGYLTRTLRHKAAAHQALTSCDTAGLLPLLHQLQPTHLIALGPHGPVFLQTALSQSPHMISDHVWAPPTRTWYAADEPASFALSCLRHEPPTRWPLRLRQAAVFATLQRTAAPAIQTVIGVSPTDTCRLQRLTRAPHALNLPNGVDPIRFPFRPPTPPGHPALAGWSPDHSLAFWGNLAFEPNADAARFLLKRVWPKLIKQHPDAKLSLIGPNLPDALQRLTNQPGVTVTGHVPDLPALLHQHALAVMPFRLGLGIKNKLLEAAALGLPIIASPHAVRELTPPTHTPIPGGQRPPVTPPQPWLLAKTPNQWLHQITHLWAHPTQATTLARTAHTWVRTHHDWPTQAQTLLHHLNRLTPPTHQPDDMNSEVTEHSRPAQAAQAA
ncbi:MAG: glycosyltransferase [Planctomycetota bacterium]